VMRCKQLGRDGESADVSDAGRNHGAVEMTNAQDRHDVGFKIVHNDGDFSIHLVKLTAESFYLSACLLNL